MILTEISPISSGALPFYNFKNHLRMGTGFAEENLQDPLLEAYLRAAIASIENKLGIAVITRGFSWNLTGWRDNDRQSLPIRPVQAISSVTIADKAGATEAIDSDDYVLVQDGQCPTIKAIRGCLPSVPTDGTVTIEIQAGFGVGWDDVPDDLAQSVLLLASYFYENRMGAPLASGVLPAAVLGLIEPYRSIRLLGARP
jgi:uncharacterized phiE125 gp8 family phage protein